MIPLQKLPKNMRDLGKLIVAKGLKKFPKVQKIAQSGHTVHIPHPTKSTVSILQPQTAFISIQNVTKVGHTLKHLRPLVSGHCVDSLQREP